MIKRMKGIRSQFIGMSIIVIFFTLATVNFIIGYQIIKQTEIDYYNNSLSQMKLVEASINSFYSQIDQNINMMATNPLVMKADSSITSYANNENEEQMTPSKNGGIEQEIYQTFQHYADTHPGTMYVYFGTEDGSYLQWPETKIPAKFVPKEKGWYQAAIDGDGTITRTDPYVDGISNVMITSNVRSFTDSAGNVIGTLGIDVQQSVISDMLSKMKTGKTGFSMIVHNTGVILADGNNPENNFQKLNEIGVTGIEKLLSDHLEQFNVKINGTTYMVNPYKVEGTDWILASFQSVNEIRENANRMSVMLVIILLITLVITVIIISVVTSRITTPIIKSSEYLNTIAKGDFSIEIDSKLLSRKDEIGSITNAIKDMKNALKQLINRISKESIAIEEDVEYAVTNVTDLNTSIGDISATTEELAASMEETAASSEEISATSQEIERAVQFIAEKSQVGASAAGDITVRAENTKKNVNEAQRKANVVFENNKKKLTYYKMMLERCLYCGLCVEACPTDALYSTTNFERTVFFRKDLETILYNQPLTDNELSTDKEALTEKEVKGEDQ
jgi:methyl-accepting chemotaxis protein